MEKNQPYPDEAFHLYLLIGQSNMAGRGEVGRQDRVAHPRVLALDRTNAWVPAVDPIHFDKPVAGVGPGLSFGKHIAHREAQVRVGLIPCAAGGSPISVWVPGGYWAQTDSHPYDDAIARTRRAREDGILKGVLWHQGESDRPEAEAAQYQERLTDLIHRLRRDLALPELPFVAATLGDFVIPGYPGAVVVNRTLERLPELDPYSVCVSSAGLPHKGDGMHFSAAAARELGRRYADAMVGLL